MEESGKLPVPEESEKNAASDKRKPRFKVAESFSSSWRRLLRGEALAQTEPQNKLPERLAHNVVSHEVTKEPLKPEVKSKSLSESNVKDETAHEVDLSKPAEVTGEQPLELWRQAFEHRAAPTPQTEQAPLPTPTNVETTNTALDKTAIKGAEIAVEGSKPVAEKILKPKEILAKPEVVLQLEQVEAAAESNVALEGLYELRHEIKDEPTKIPPPAAITGASTPSTPPPPVAPPMQPLISQVRPELAIIDDEISAPRIPTLYRQAALNGLWAACVILVVIALVAVVR